MRWGLGLLSLVVAGAVGFELYSKSQNVILGLSGPRFNLAVKNTPALAEIDLGEVIQGMEGRHMRGRYVIVQPGQTIRIHNHTGRPAFSYIVNATVDLHRSDQPGPLHLVPGDLTQDVNISHWWKNTSGYPLTFYVVDIYRPAGGKGE